MSKSFMRSIRISIPSWKVKLAMWESTEDEAAFPIRAIGSRKPYITAYGIRYDNVCYKGEGQ